jgi:hypothetical protein
MYVRYNGGTWTEFTVQVSAAVTDAVANETGDTGAIAITRTGPIAAPLSVNVAIAGTATPGADYATITTPVTIAAGAASASLSVTALADGLPEGSETVTATVAAGSYYTATGSPATVTITDTSTAPIPWPSGKRGRLWVEPNKSTLIVEAAPGELRVGFPELNAPSWRQFRILSPEELEE